MAEKKKAEKKTLFDIQVEPSAGNGIPAWSMFCTLVLRRTCPHCSSFHSLFKIKNGSEKVKLCCRIDYDKHVELVRKLSEEG